MIKHLLALGVRVVLTCFPSVVFAQAALFEQEPNNTPATANKFAGAAVIMGSMRGSDQDGFEWTVSDVDASKRWTFELQGIAGALTIVEVLRVEYADNGVEVLSRDKLFVMGTRDGSKPSVHENLLFEPGEYILGVATAGGGADGPYRPPFGAASFDGASAVQQAPVQEEAGAYRLIIREGDAMHPEQGVRSASSLEQAFKLRLGSHSSFMSQDNTVWYQLELDANQAAQKWDINGQVPVGRSAGATLVDLQQNRLANVASDNKGKISFRDLSLEQGTYFIELQTPESGFLRSMETASVGVRVEGAEAEPNDNPALANRVDLTQPLQGQFSTTGDSDWFTFSLDESGADNILEFQLTTDAESKLTFCLTNDKGQRLQCREGTGGVELPDLQLTPGDWGFLVERGNAGTQYVVSLLDQGAIEAGREVEPNERLEFASTIPGKNRIKGRFTGEDTDFYKLLVTEEPQLWRIQVLGEEIFEVAYIDASGAQSQTLRVPTGQKRVRLENVFLLPGMHHIRVSGRDGGDYTLLARPMGPPDPNGELEPNDDTSRMQSLRFGQTRTGLLQDAQDRDNFRFHLANTDRIRLTLEPPVDGGIGADLYWDGGYFKEFNNPVTGSKVILEGLFPPGDYRLELSAKAVSEAEYKLSLERLPRFSCATDCEPNDNMDFANELPADHILTGIAQDWRDADWYRLPVFDQPTEIHFSAQQRPQVSLRARGGTDIPLDWNAEGGYTQAIVPAGVQTYANVGSSGEYRISVEIFSRPIAAVPAVPVVEVDLVLADQEVAAYQYLGQQIGGELQLSNSGTSTTAVSLEAASSDIRWASELAQERVEIPAGGTVSIPIKIAVPADAWADTPVRISVLATDGSGAKSEAYAEVKAGREAALVNPRQAWSIPDELRGGLNVARDVLGGHWLGEPDTAVGDFFSELIDGMAVKDQGVRLRGSSALLAVDVDVELAGGEPVVVSGFAINQLGRGSAADYLRNLDFSVSMDGSNYTPAFEGELLPVASEQHFVLKQPVTARYARLGLRESFSGIAGPALSFGEFKVIAKPGLDLSAGKGFNLAEPALGGHVVWSRPVGASSTDKGVLNQDDKSERRRINSGEAYELVVGFNHNRAAQITRMEWVNLALPGPGVVVEKVAVSTSIDSPVGPWQPLGEWDLTASDNTTTFDMPENTWARFVKLSLPGGDEQIEIALPDAVRIWERPTQDEYRSILGEWGFASQEAIYEELHPLKIEPAVAATENDTKLKAAELLPDRSARGQVLLGKHEQWYRLDVPPGQNVLRLQLRGDPSVRTVLEVQKTDGTEIPVVRNEGESTPQLHVLEAIVEPGEAYFVKVQEPPRNVLFLWDTSASVGAYLPVIYNAMLQYVEDVVPGKDAANLLPFGGELLSKDWYGEPYILQTILNDYLRQDDSSEAEHTLARASQFLAPRAGTKAIVMVTDAATGIHAPVWQEFQAVQPRIFGLGVGSQGAFGRDPVSEQDLMQDWSRVNGGYYSTLQSEGEMEIAFDRAVTMLRRPADYTLDASFQYSEVPGPGGLQVKSSNTGGSAAGGAAIELILDASGSMLKRLDGKRRIAIAKEVLAEAVNKHIPAGTPVALRVFGHKEPNACRSDLEVPLAPLTAASMLKAIDSVQAMNLAKTPIADSLAAVAADLKGVKGRKIVVLLTDGEETCEGDPAAIVQKLQKDGVDVTLNVIGFAIDDPQLEEQFQSWAALGGGRYFQAQNQKGLRAAIQDALAAPYKVYDQTGAMVAQGLVDGPAVALEQGFYRVVVQSAAAKTYDKIQVAAGQVVVLP